MSTADHAGHPLRPSPSSSGDSARRSTSVAGTPGGSGSGSGDSGGLRRIAGETPSATSPTAPVPVTASRGAAAGAGAASSSATSSGSKPAPRPAANRRVRLTVSRVDPWSAMKISFLLSVALGIAMVVMVFVLWTILAGMGVFDQINGVIGQVVQDGGNRFDIMDFIGLGRVVSLSIVIAVIDVVLITAISTLVAFLYNVSSALVGGVQLTLTDD